MSRYRNAEVPSYGSASDPHRDRQIHELHAEVQRLRDENRALFDNARAARLEIRRIEKAGTVTMDDVYGIELALDGHAAGDGAR